MNELLLLENLDFSRGDFHLHFSARIHRGEFVSLLGPSGCGKTTILRLIAGLERPDAGKILLEGKNITWEKTEDRNIGLVFQDYALFPHLNVFENAAYGPKNRKWAADKVLQEVNALLAAANLQGYEKRKVTELSGGEKQRVALVRALAPSPEILLLDEPLSALDAGLRLSLRTKIKEIQQKTGITLIYVTHDQEEAMALSDRIFLMNRGRLIQQGPPERIYNEPANLFAADFMGEANLITLDNKHLLFFRPEAVTTEPPAEEYSTFRGPCIHQEFRGAYYSCLTALESGEILHWNAKQKTKTKSEQKLYVAKRLQKQIRKEQQ